MERMASNVLIQRIEKQLDNALEGYYKSGNVELHQQIEQLSNDLKMLRDAVLQTERIESGKDIRSNMKLLSIGYGFVGSVVGDSIKTHIKEHVIIDPQFSKHTIKMHRDADAAIVCLPTPTVNGVCDDSLVASVIAELNEANPDMHILLKSTVTPEQLETYPHNVTFNPEFLRQDYAKQDYNNQTFMILGGSGGYWHRVFTYLQDVEILRTDRSTASMVKYMHNTWLAMKVAYFHEVFNALGDKYNHDEMKDILSKFTNIGPSHMAMNNTGGLGFGGDCFPKDTQAFQKYSGSEILNKVIAVNEKLLNAK